MNEQSKKQAGGEHTPGPWKANYTIFHGNTVGFHITCNTYGSLHPICETNVKTKTAFSSDEIKANAALIAAAPMLLAALEALFYDYKALADSGDAGFWKLENQPAGKQALAAICAAKGS